jgi:hypothetical protein
VTTNSQSAFETPAPGLSQSPDNRREQVIVHHLLREMALTMTDRGGEKHVFPWAPDQEVRVGVLGPLFKRAVPIVDADAGDHGEVDIDEDGGVSDPSTVEQSLLAAAPPIENRGVIGVDFVIAGTGSMVNFSIDLEYAIYQPLLPEFSEISREAKRQADAASGDPKKRPRVPVRPGWQRDNRRVAVAFSVPVGSEETEFSSISGFPGGDPFEEDARDAVVQHFLDPLALFKLENNQTVAVADAMGTPEHFSHAIQNRRDLNWSPTWPIPRLEITTLSIGMGTVAVSVSIRNAREAESPRPQDIAIYDARLAVTVDGGWSITPQRLRLVDDDIRYAEVATVLGRGRGCVAVSGETSESIVAETLPVYVQHVMNPLTHAADLRFSSLSKEYLSTLDLIAAEMRTFHRSWDSTGDGTVDGRSQLEELRRRFELEVERFELGRDLLQSDPRLDKAFRFANLAFAGSRGSDASWRLFQLVFIVTELGALEGREDTESERLRTELNSVDVLWFPTGGGKTEAYLGLILVALYFDRLRSKERGTTAWLLFPLRMLSVQQLARVSEIVYHAERVRDTNDLGGDPFSLGYLVGAGNTPNRLRFDDANSWWRGIEWFSQLEQAERDSRRLVGACPRCSSPDSVGLDADVVQQRLRHICRACGFELPIYPSDEEVTRFQPSIIVSTVDKLTAFSRNGELTSLHHGPRMRCSDHGWYTHGGCRVAGCRVDKSTHVLPTGFKDPVPSLWIQDELHLVREELGVFAGHYHTLLAELAKGAGLLPSKVIAATATIEQYEDQLRQVYGREPRLFPIGGPSLKLSFYTEQISDIRRIFLGVMPSGGGTAKVDLAADTTRFLIERVHYLLDDPSEMIAALAEQGIIADSAEVQRDLFNYELALAYVNSKAHGVAILDDVLRLSQDLMDRGSDRILAHYVMGETSLSELASVVARIQTASISDPRVDRIRALVGTAVISHGVDLDRLNFEVLAGMPATYAEYIQSTSRAGRSHVGLVVSTFDRNNRRETSMFQSFMSTHSALERMVAPVPVNRYATRAVERTLPGIVCALLWDETRNPAWPETGGISMTRYFEKWWNANAANLMPVLQDRIEGAYRCPVPDSTRAVDEQKLVDDALNRWEQVERQRMQQWQDSYMVNLFTRSAMTSLRDVETPVEFSGGNRAQRIIERILD